MRESGDPIRSELLSVEQLEQFVAALAGEHVVRPGRTRGRRLLPRLRENARVLLRAHRTIAEAGRRSRSVLARRGVAPQQLPPRRGADPRDSRGPPAGFYRELPKLAAGTLEGYPRVYGLAWSFVAHTDSRIELATLRRFVAGLPARGAADDRRALGAGHLSASRARRESPAPGRARSPRARRPRARRTRSPTRSSASGDAPKPRAGGGASRARGAPLLPAFAVQLVQRLREQDPAVTPALDWLDERLAREGTTADELVRVEHQAQAATHATVRNVITSMRLLSPLDWADFFESVSLVHESCAHGTRVAEWISRRATDIAMPIEELARGLVRRARGGAARGGSGGESPGGSRVPRGAAGLRFGDPGYYLISKGRRRSSASSASAFAAQQWLRRAWVRAATPLYLVVDRSHHSGGSRGAAGPDARSAASGRRGARPSRAPRPLARVRPRDRARPPLRHAASGPPAAPEARARPTASRPSCARSSRFRCF